MKKNIFAKIVIPSLVAIFVVIFLVIFVYSTSNQGVFVQNVSNYLSGVAATNSKNVESFLSGVKRDVIYLSGATEVKDIFDAGVIEDTNLMKETVKSVAQKTAKDVQDYLDSHPDSTMEMLQSDPDFKKIAIRKIGQTGYTVFYGPETFINYLHFDPARTGYGHEDLFEDESQKQVADLLLIASKTGEDTEGFYTLKEADGGFREKYMYISVYPKRYFNGIELSSKAIIYVDEFGKTAKIASDLDKKLSYFANLSEYLDLLIADDKGNIIWSTGKRNDLGSSLIDGAYKDTILADLYKKVMDTGKLEVSDTFFYDASAKDVFFVANPVLGIGGKKIGAVFMEIDESTLENLISGDGVSVDPSSEVYIVNAKNNTNITSLKFSDSHLHQTISSKQIDSCLDKSLSVGSESYENYSGSSVFGTSNPISGTDWCVVVEVAKSGVFRNFVKSFSETYMLYVIVGSIFIGFFIVFFVLQSVFAKKSELKISRKGVVGDIENKKS